MPVEFSRIAVWNTAFLGDAALTLPLLQSLRAAFPCAEIHFFVRRGFASLFSSHRAIDQVHEYDKKSGGSRAGVLSHGRELSGLGFDLWICAHPSFRSALLARLSRADMRIGYAESCGRVFSRFFFTHPVSRRFAELEEIERLGRLLLPLKLPKQQNWPDIQLPEDSLERAADYFRQHGRGPVVGLHPGSVWGTKRWPVEHFARLGASIVAAGAQVMLFAGPGEEGAAQKLAAGIREQAGPLPHDALLDVAGRLSLPDLAAWLGRLSCYVTNDSGPMHLAWPQGTPVCAVFGPTVRRLGFFPRGPESTVFEADLDCRPCGLHGPQSCPLKHHRCMREVLPEDVWRAVREYLK